MYGEEKSWKKIHVTLVRIKKNIRKRTVSGNFKLLVN